ncbi:unnamed protein product [Mytilus coruscus]|uniref:Reverse transcriptase domain-containing protein n=1 Tax=Mytilus coruscus TaxID=42192 RepID=A0A6J8DSD9_MYTCO|nr:unnamed protein product [Mytilus coruscus]
MGVAICVRKKFDQYTELLPDGGNRIIAIKLKFEKPLILFCAYMPTTGSNTHDDYQAVFDEIAEIVEKYGANADILGGDMNASLHRKDGVSSDQTFKIFLEEQKLFMPNQCRRQNTFYHYNGRDESQINYFLQSEEIIAMYTTFVREPENTSTHDPVLVLLQGATPIEDIQNLRKQIKRIIWKKIDKQKYAKDVEDDLKSFSSDITCENAAEKIQQLCTILSKNAEKQCKQHIKKRKNRKICWNPEIAAVAKTSKECYGKWKTLGKQKDPTQSAYIDLRNTLIKSGIVCPVFKNGGKPKDDPNSYRKIKITSSVGKVVEKIHLSRNEDKILVRQSNLQKGFTKGESPCIAALIITELIIEAKERKSSLYIALMDARKVFDILWHLGLLGEMHKTVLEGNNWLFFENWYTELTSKVKWKGELSHQIIEQQGVRKGGIWSPSAYKLFANSLLTTFKENQIGAIIGSIYCGKPTVADDVTLITTDPYELQTMLDIQSRFANKNRNQ